MSGYYDDHRITYAEAEKLVEEYIDEKKETRTWIKARQIAENRGIDTAYHNIVRINDALEERLKKRNAESNGAQRFKIPNE